MESTSGTQLGQDDLRLLAAVGEHVDVALHRARLYEEARASEKRFTAFVGNSPAAAWMKDEEGAFVYANRAFTAPFGRLPDGVLGKDDFSLLPPADAERVRADDAEVRATGQPREAEEAIPLPGGGDRDWLTLKFPFDDPSGARFVGGVALDVTERRRAEAALEASERRFRSLVQNASDVVTILAADGTVRYASPAVARVLGHDPAELVGADAFALVHPEDRVGARARFLEAQAEPGAHAPVSFRFRHKDGSWRWLEGVGTNLLADPDVGGIVFNSRDVTEQRRLAAEAARATALAESDRLKSALLATVSHELRTPLATIKTGVSSLLSTEAEWTASEQNAFLCEIEAELDRLALMVGNLLDLTRIEGGALRPRLGWHDVGELVVDVVERLGHRAAGRPISAEVEPDLPLVTFDYVQVAQVLLNLADNALRYTPPGTPVVLAARRVPGAVELAVSDRGPGIPRPEANRVFEKFYRLDPDANSSGAGLGLAISKGLVEAHGGRIWVEGREGVGTVVRFTLPLPLGNEEAT